MDSAKPVFPMTPDYTLDCTGMSCPMPVLKTGQAIRDLAVGQILELIASDPGARSDLEVWARQFQHDLLAVGELADGRLRILIRKTH